MKLLRLFLLFSWFLFFMTRPVPPAFPADAEPPAESKRVESKEPEHIGAIPTYVQKKIYKKVRKQNHVDFSIKFACIGDVDGDGTRELISTDSRRLSIVQCKYGEFHPLVPPAQEGKSRFSSFWPWSKGDSERSMEAINKLNKGIQYLSLTAEDLDGDGRDEILFTGMKDHELLSGIITFKNRGFSQYQADAGLYLKAFHEEGGRPVLAGQNLHAGKKETNRYLWDGNSLQKGASMDLPGEADIFNTDTYLSGGPDGPAYVTLGHPEGLRFFSSDLKMIMETALPGRIKQSFLPVHAGDDQGKSKKKRVRVSQKFLSGDFDKDGMDEVILIVERPWADIWGIRHLFKVQVAADMILANGHVVEFWDSEPVFGEILDLTVGDADNNGKDDLVLIIKGGLNPFGGGTKILIYDF